MSTATNRPINRRVVLAKHPKGMVAQEDFRFEEEPAREPMDGEVLVKVDTISIDAFIRTSLNEQEGFHMAVPIGGTVIALGAGRVVESNAEGFEEGDAVSGPTGAQTYMTAPSAMFQKVDDSLPLSTYVGALGLTTGLTAYCGLRGAGQVKEGDTVLVSAAAGAVGSVAAQVAKNLGAKVIGIAGGSEKCAFLVDELGLDSAIDYKGEDVAAKLKELAPDGIDVFFDNVGGDILDAALGNLREGARVVICGAISQYGDQQNIQGPTNYLQLAEKNARMEGFVVTRFAEDFPGAVAQITEWIKDGKLKMREDVEEGIDSFPTALRKLFEGGNTGKMIVKP